MLGNVHEVVRAIDAVSTITVARQVSLENLTTGTRLQALLCGIAIRL
jgi:hypothetical protein